MSGETARRSPSGTTLNVFRDVVIDAAAVGAASVLHVVVAAPAFPEAEVGDRIEVECDALEADLGFGGAFVHVAGGFTFRLVNPSAAPINPASHTYRVTLTKPGPTL
jgi:hypothetical protein